MLTARKEIIPLEVATGVLVRDGRVFIQRRRPDDVWAGLWEFPGGIVEPDETDEQAVAREMRRGTGFRGAGPCASWP